MDFRYFNQETGKWESAIVGPDEFNTLNSEFKDLESRYSKHSKYVSDWDAVTTNGMYVGNLSTNNQPAGIDWLLGCYESLHDMHGVMIGKSLLNDDIYTRRRADSQWLPWVKIQRTFGTASTQDYVEGVFTPVFVNSGSTTYQEQYGKYTRIGKLVFISIILVTGIVDRAAMDPQTAVMIGGLPFAGASMDSSLSAGFTNLPVDNALYIVLSQNLIHLNDGQTTYLGSRILDNKWTRIAGSYMIP